jgi:hypothetical protein
MQVIVGDAQYVRRGDPMGLLPNQEQSQAYFAPALEDYCGRSLTDLPYNRSCQFHAMNLEEGELGEDDHKRNNHAFPRIW